MSSRQYINGSTRTADIIVSDTEPTSPFPCMVWADITNGLLKLRNLANTGWESVGTIIGTDFYQPTIDAGFNSVQGILGLKLGTWGSPSFSITEDGSYIYFTGHVSKDIKITTTSGKLVILTNIATFNPNLGSAGESGFTLTHGVNLYEHGGYLVTDQAFRAVSGLKAGDGTDGVTANVAVAKVGGGTRTLQFKNGLYVGYSDS
jgi:hypothetical protein